jgi:hypothetical protein
MAGTNLLVAVIAGTNLVLVMTGTNLLMVMNGTNLHSSGDGRY